MPSVTIDLELSVRAPFAGDALLTFGNRVPAEIAYVANAASATYQDGEL